MNRLGENVHISWFLVFDKVFSFFISIYSRAKKSVPPPFSLCRPLLLLQSCPQCPLTSETGAVSQFFSLSWAGWTLDSGGDLPPPIFLTGYFKINVRILNKTFSEMHKPLRPNSIILESEDFIKSKQCAACQESCDSQQPHGQS